ncbi:MAG TPA: hypothetical protein VK470_12500 [Bacteroidota bacterium]|nr:hypothetical protein [Bacteroidota bacterium]
MNRPIVRHIFAVLMLLVMTLTSTGFTAIVKYCAMTESSDCCCQDTDKGSSPVAVGLFISAPEVSCFTQHVAGGRNEITATLHTNDSVTLQALDVLPVDSYTIGSLLSSHCFSLLSTDDAAPPGVDIYIRVNSLLI